MSRSRNRMVADWFTKLRVNASNEVEHPDVADMDLSAKADTTYVDSQISSINVNNVTGNLTVSGGVKLGNDTREANTAGAGAMAYNTTDGLVVSDGAEWKAVKTSTPAADAGFRRQGGGCASGTLSTDGKTWTAQSNVTHSYSGVVVDWAFANDFEVIVSWQHDYMGAGFVWDPNADPAQYYANGELATCQATYWGAAESGFEGIGYSKAGQYHIPITGQGATSHNTKYYFKMSRVGNNLYWHYSTAGTAGPWSDFSSGNPAATISSNDKVIVGFGEAHQNENDPLRLLSITGS